MTRLHGVQARTSAESAGPDRVGLDHVGLYARDMGPTAAMYERLGFQLTPLSQHSGTHVVTREVVKAGIANRCAMLGHGYIELVAVVDPALDLRGIPDGLARYAGMHIVAFDTAEPEQRIEALREAGFEAEPGVLQRYIDTPLGPRLARFSQVRTPRTAMPEGLILTLRHETPELLWQERYQSHPNGARALAAVIVAVDDLDETAARYERYLGVSCVRRGGEAWFRLRSGCLGLVGRAELNERLPGCAVPGLPFPAALAVEVADLSRTAAVLDDHQVPYRRAADQLVVAAEHAGGASLIFCAGAIFPCDSGKR
ncbi:VOC family protein [Achromobacter aegrifaciens]